MCLDLYVHWVSRSMHLTELKQSDWVISAWIINEFENLISKCFLVYFFFTFVVMKGWYSHHPGHSCKDIRDSRDSKGDREHWIDPEKSGNPLKVFCDMTTDGGKLRMVSKEYSYTLIRLRTLSFIWNTCGWNIFLLNFASLWNFWWRNVSLQGSHLSGVILSN